MNEKGPIFVAGVKWGARLQTQIIELLQVTDRADSDSSARGQIHDLKGIVRAKIEFLRRISPETAVFYDEILRKNDC
ncbi:MAG: hypothetical protein RIQ56_80 [Candidatus Parcubacteria bacterium]|jgi:hypothetical protein